MTATRQTTEQIADVLGEAALDRVECTIERRNGETVFATPIGIDSTAVRVRPRGEHGQPPQSFALASIVSARRLAKVPLESVGIHLGRADER